MMSVLADARVANASAQLALAKADFPTQEELDIAKAEVNAAKANLEAIQVQIGLLVIKSPVDGVVLTRNIEHRRSNSTWACCNHSRSTRQINHHRLYPRR